MYFKMHSKPGMSAAFVGFVLAFMVLPQWSRADVFVAGNVLLDPDPNGGGFYSDNPFTTINEGIPKQGNKIDPFLLGLGFAQSDFEGRRVDNGPGLADDENINFNITVGQTSFGSLLISGEIGGTLRDMDLIIGDAGEDLNMQPRRGTGVVRITGFGALYNNDPFILPFVPPAGVTPQNISVNPRLSELGAQKGFDLYVGRAGTGTLEISLGGRAEIQDAVVVADQAGSTGTLIVDGIGSFLGSGGFEDGGPQETNHMIIGRRGLGSMYIQNGGEVVAQAPTGSADPRLVVGAVIGSDPFDNLEPMPGGQGTATVTGLGSKWIIFGGLQVGGFDDADDSMNLGKDFEGDDVAYDSLVGRGTLKVLEGGIVNVLLPPSDQPPLPNAELLFVIGRFGRVELNGGYISVGVAGEMRARSDRMQVINDGIIKGSGRIDTGVFRNRYLGQVRVGPAQSLIIDSSSEFSLQDLTDVDVDDEPLVNFGLIEVVGTVESRAEIEFIRAPTFEDNPIRPLINRRIGTTAGGVFDGGTISAQHATLRFQSGVFNKGLMAFTEGMNIISGRVDNIVGESNGLFEVFPNTTVVIQDDFSSGGIETGAVASPPIVSVLAGGTLSVVDSKSFTLKGILEMEVSLTNPSIISVAGDVGLRGDLHVSFASDALTSISHGDAFELINFAGDIGGVDDATDPVKLRPDLTVNPVLNVVPTPAFQTLYPNLNLITVRFLHSMYLMALDPSMVGPPGGAGAMGPDFNGDGFVDNDDLAIWQANVGITMGASVLQGDADGDGDVDGDDFLIWQVNIGPFPGAGAGSGAGHGLAGSVPEPTGLLLLLGSAVATLTVRTRRSHCFRR